MHPHPHNKAFKRFWAGACLLLLACFTPLNGYAQVHVRVVDAETGLALPGTTVQAENNQDTLYSYTDSTGRGTISISDSVHVHLKRLGYMPLSITMWPHTKTQTVYLHPSPLPLHEVQVSAPLIARRYAEVNGGFHQITQQTIRNQGAVTSAGFLTHVPGVFMQQGTYGTNKLVIRGIGSRASYGTNRIKAYLDEIPLTNGEGVTTFEDLDPLMLAGAEIMKGATSALYGADLGGTLRLYSDTLNKMGTEGFVHSAIGSFGMFRNAVSLGHQQNESYLQAFYAHTQTDGFRQNNQYRRSNVMLKSGTRIGQSRLTILFIHTNLYGQIPSSLNQSMFENTPEAAAPNWLAVKGYEAYRKSLGGLTVESPLGTRLTNTLSLSGNLYNGYERRPFNVLDDASNRFALRQRLTWKTAQLEVIGGLEYQLEKYAWKLYETETDGQGDLFSDNRENRHTGTLFLLGNWRIAPHLSADAGLSITQSAYRVHDTFTDDSTDYSGKFTGTPILSPRVGITYRLHPYNTLYASIRHGFSLPSVEEALLPEGNINTDLAPEKGLTYELGLRGNLGKTLWQYDLSLYASSVNNMLVTKRLSEDEFMSINAGKTAHKGLELWVAHRLQLHRSLTLQFSGSYSLSHHYFVDFRDDGADFSGKQMPGIPQQQGYLGLETRLLGHFSLAARITATGSQYLNDANTAQYAGFHTIDLNAGYTYQWAGGVLLTLKARVENLLNTSYASMILINAPSFGSNAPRYYYPGMPQNLLVTLTLSK